MLTALGAYVREKAPDQTLLGYLLARMISVHQEGFLRIADCGGGIGSATIVYRAALEKNLTSGLFSRAEIFTYEPLPENLVELRGRVGGLSGVTVRPVAVGANAGTAHFVVPNRMTGQATYWGQGTSADGYLGSSATRETVSVEVVRLEDEPGDFDFVKMDLQGGERAALDGMGAKAARAKLMCVEQSLLGAPEAPPALPLSVLHDLGFICAYDQLQFGFNPAVGEIPLKLLADGGIELTNIRPPNGRGLPFMIFGRFRFGGATALMEDGAIRPDYAASLKTAGIPWMATDIIAINKNVYAETVA